MAENSWFQVDGRTGFDGTTKLKPDLTKEYPLREKEFVRVAIVRNFFCYHRIIVFFFPSRFCG